MEETFNRARDEKADRIVVHAVCLEGERLIVDATVPPDVAEMIRFIGAEVVLDHTP